MATAASTLATLAMAMLCAAGLAASSDVAPAEALRPRSIATTSSVVEKHNTAVRVGGAGLRRLRAMGINDVEAAVSRLFEAKRDALEYANK